MEKHFLSDILFYHRLRLIFLTCISAKELHEKNLLPKYYLIKKYKGISGLSFIRANRTSGFVFKYEK